MTGAHEFTFLQTNANCLVAKLVNIPIFTAFRAPAIVPDIASPTQTLEASHLAILILMVGWPILIQRLLN